MSDNKNEINKKERHILALSGGKDSAALAIYMRKKHPDLELDYVFTDSGCELPETYEYLDKIRAVLNVEIRVVRPEKSWENYWTLAKVKQTKCGCFTYLPSPQNRWCTELLKIMPYKKWLKKNYPNCVIHSYVGLRADEKRERKGIISSDLVIPHYPFIEDGLKYDDIINLLLKERLGLPGYYKWRQRSGCYFCFYQTKREWLGLYDNHPDLYMKAMSYEAIIPEQGIRYTWCEDMSLEQLLYIRESILMEPFSDDKYGKTPDKLSKILVDIFD